MFKNIFFDQLNIHLSVTVRIELIQFRFFREYVCAATFLRICRWDKRGELQRRNKRVLAPEKNWKSPDVSGDVEEERGDGHRQLKMSKRMREAGVALGCR